MKSNTTIKTPLKKAKALGSAHQGAHHWWMERLTSVALVPLIIWFVYSVLKLTHAEHLQVLNFFESPINTVLMGLLVIISFYHTSMGLQVIVEDYVHVRTPKFIILLVIKLGCFALGLASILAIAKLHFGG